MKIRKRKMVISYFLFFLLAFSVLTVFAFPMPIRAETVELNNTSRISSVFWTENDNDLIFGNGVKNEARKIDSVSISSAYSGLSWIWDNKMTSFAEKLSSDEPHEYTFGEYFALKGAFITYNKLDPNNKNRVIYSASFDATDNTKDELLLEFLPIPYSKPDLSSATPNHRNIGIKLVDDKDDSKSVTLYYDVIAKNAMSATLKVQQGGQYGAAPSGLEEHLVTDFAYFTLVDTQKIYYDSTEKAIYADTVSQNDDTYSLPVKTKIFEFADCSGFSDSIHIEAFYTTGSGGGNSIIFTAMDGINLSTGWGGAITELAAKTHDKLPNEIFDRNTGEDGSGKAYVELPVDESGSTLPNIMSYAGGLGVLYDSGSIKDRFGKYPSRVTASVSSVNIGDNTKKDSLITLTPVSNGNETFSQLGITDLMVVIAETANPANYFAVNIFAFDQGGPYSAHAVAAAVGQQAFGARSSGDILADTQRGNYLIASPATFGSELYTISYDKAENAVYLNGNIIRDFDWTIGAEGADIVFDGQFGSPWSGFETDEVSVTIMNLAGGGLAYITDIDGQTLDYTEIDGELATCASIKTEIFNRTLKGGTGCAVMLDALTKHNLFDGYSDYKKDVFVKVKAPSGTVEELGAYGAGISFTPVETGLHTIEYYEDSVYNNKLGEAYLKVHDGRMYGAFDYNRESCSIDAAGASSINNVVYKQNADRVHSMFTTKSIEGLMISAKHGEAITLDKALNLNDNYYNDEDDCIPIIEFAITPDWLRHSYSSMEITLTDNETGDKVVVKLGMDDVDQQKDTQLASAITSGGAYVTVSAPNGAGGADIVGQVRHDGGGYKSDKISLRLLSQNGFDANVGKLVYDAREKTIYMTPYSNENRFPLRHFSPTQEQKTEFGYPESYEAWDGFKGSVTLSIKFDIFNGGNSDCYQYLAGGKADTAKIIITSIDGQTLSIGKNGDYAYEKKTLAAPDQMRGAVGETCIISAPDMYSLFADGGYGEYTDFDGTIRVEKDGSTILEETDFSDGISFIPEVSGVYDVIYSKDGKSVTAEYIVVKSLTVGTISGGEHGKLYIDGKEVAQGQRLDFSDDVTLTFESDPNYAVTSVIVGTKDYTDQIKDESIVISFASSGENDEITVVFSAVYKLTLMDGQSIVEVINIIQGLDYPTLDEADYEKSGYKFSGWYSDETFELEFDFSGTVSGDSVVYVKYIPIEYSVNYIAGGGDISGVYTEKYTVEDCEINLPSVTRSGYNFDGWYSDETFTEQFKVESGEYVYAAGGLELYAKWTPISFSIEYMSAGGTLSGDYTVEFTVEDSVLVLPNVVKNGYEFGGWFSDADCMDANKVVGGNYDFPAAGMILYAKWSVVTYSIEYHAPGATLSGEYTKNYTVEDDIINVPDASLEGYEFNGWFVDAALELSPVEDGDYIFEAGGLVLYAKFTIRSYTVSFVVNGGTAVDNAEYAHGSFIVAPTITREGYTFAGWYADEALTEKFDFASASITGDVTLYAKWTENENGSKEPEQPSGEPEKPSGCTGCGSENASLFLTLIAVLGCGLIVKKF